jgi:hypothetical protein
MGFQENLAALAPADTLARIELTGPDGSTESIENRPGSQGSLRVYRHLALKHGEINPAAAAEGLVLYAEHTEDARAHPGKHPNIDRLMEVKTRNLRLTVRLIEAIA